MVLVRRVCLGWLPGRLNEIPEIPVKVFEYSDCAVWLNLRLPYELNPFQTHLIVIAPEIVSTQEEKYSSSGLVSDERYLNRF